MINYPGNGRNVSISIMRTTEDLYKKTYNWSVFLPRSKSLCSLTLTCSLSHFFYFHLSSCCFPHYLCLTLSFLLNFLSPSPPFLISSSLLLVYNLSHSLILFLFLSSLLSSSYSSFLLCLAHYFSAFLFPLHSLCYLIPRCCCPQSIYTSCIYSILPCVIPLFSHSARPPFLLSLFSLFSGASLTPFIHLFSRQWIRSQRLLYISLHASLSWTSHPCVFQPRSRLPPVLFYLHSLSLPRLRLLSCSNLSPEGSDWQASGGLVWRTFWLVVREMKR